MSAEELIDLFQRPLYDIQRAWRAPLFRIVQRLSQGILQGSPENEERCTLAFLILPGLVAECHYGKWIPVAGLLWHLEQGIDRVCSDEEFVTLFLRQAGQVVPRIKAYREQPKKRTGLLDHWIIPDWSPFGAISNALLVSAVLAWPTGS